MSPELNIVVPEVLFSLYVTPVCLLVSFNVAEFPAQIASAVTLGALTVVQQAVEEALVELTAFVNILNVIVVILQPDETV